MITRHPIRARRGAAAVELALTLPLLLFLFVAAVDYARVYFIAQIVADSARSAALYAANPDLGERTPYETATEMALAGAKDLDPAPTVSVITGTDSAGREFVEVSVSHPFKLICPIVSPSQFDIKRTARARLFPSAKQSS